MDTEDAHAGRVNKRIRMSLPNAPGALSTVAAAVSARGGLVRAVQSLHEDLQQPMVEIDLVAADQEQCTAIIGAIKDLDGVLMEGETNPALEAHRGGTIAVQSRVPFRNEQDFSTVYTLGAVRLAQAIARARACAHVHGDPPPGSPGVSRALARCPRCPDLPFYRCHEARRGRGHRPPRERASTRACGTGSCAASARVAQAVKAAARREQVLAGRAPARPTRQEVQDAAR